MSTKLTAQEARIKSFNIGYLIKNIDKEIELTSTMNLNVVNIKYRISYDTIKPDIYKTLIKEYTDRGYITHIAPEEKEIYIYLYWGFK